MRFLFILTIILTIMTAACVPMQQAVKQPAPAPVQQTVQQSAPIIVTGPALYSESYLLPYRYAPSGFIHFEKKVWKSTGDLKARFIIIYLDKRPAGQFTYRLEPNE